MEELHSDLIPYSDDQMVHHPLIVASLLRDASHINQGYRQKKELLRRRKQTVTGSIRFPP